MQRKILLLVMLSILVVLTAIGIVSHLIVKKSIDHDLQFHAELATMISRDMDSIIDQNIARLQDITLSGPVNLAGGDRSYELTALQGAYRYSIFTDGLFLMDLDGNVVLTYPRREANHVNLRGFPFVAEALSGNKVVISDVFSFTKTGRKVIYVLVPLKNSDGAAIGVAGGEINPTNNLLSSVIRAASTEKAMRVELVDAKGTVITSNNPARILKNADHNSFIARLIRDRKKFVGICHECHATGEAGTTTEEAMLAFSPLTLAPWGVSIREPSRVVFAPSEELKKSFLAVSLVLIISSIILSMALSKSIVRPLRVLTEAAEKMADGNLSDPIEVHRHDELGTLSWSFELMRRRLNDLLGKIKRHNQELEKRIAERTRELHERKLQLSALLCEGLGAQEEERRRIARGLHDETSQSLAALGMSLGNALQALRENRLAPETIIEMERRVGTLVDGINRTIQDLRPPVLDDLGLESAVIWLLKKHLMEAGIHYVMNIKGLADLNMNKRYEVCIFRIVQEALTNVARHSKAEHVSFAMISNRSSLDVDIADTGIGFNVDEAFREYGKTGHMKGFGLLSMRERIEHLGGVFSIQSYPGEGTSVHISFSVGKIVRG